MGCSRQIRMRCSHDPLAVGGTAADQQSLTLQTKSVISSSSAMASASSTASCGCSLTTGVASAQQRSRRTAYHDRRQSSASACRSRDRSLGCRESASQLPGAAARDRFCRAKSNSPALHSISIGELLRSAVSLCRRRTSPNSEPRCTYEGRPASSSSVTWTASGVDCRRMDRPMRAKTASMGRLLGSTSASNRDRPLARAMRTS